MDGWSLRKVPVHVELEGLVGLQLVRHQLLNRAGRHTKVTQVGKSLRLICQLWLKQKKFFSRKSYTIQRKIDKIGKWLKRLYWNIKSLINNLTLQGKLDGKRHHLPAQVCRESWPSTTSDQRAWTGWRQLSQTEGCASGGQTWGNTILSKFVFNNETVKRLLGWMSVKWIPGVIPVLVVFVHHVVHPVHQIGQQEAIRSGWKEDQIQRLVVSKLKTINLNFEDDYPWLIFKLIPVSFVDLAGCSWIIHGCHDSGHLLKIERLI